MKNKSKKYTFYRSMSCKLPSGQEMSYISEVYSCGIYLCHDGHIQCSSTPQKMIKMQKRLQELSNKGEITDLKFSWATTVIDGEYGWEKVTEY